MGQIFKWLSVLGRLSNVYADQQLKESGINSSHYVFLIHICKDPGITQEQLKSTIYVHPSNITRALDHLEKEGYLIKEKLPTDKRTCKLYPTQKAREACNTISKITADWEEYITSRMTESEKKDFMSLLEQAGGIAAGYFF